MMVRSKTTFAAVRRIRRNRSAAHGSQGQPGRGPARKGRTSGPSEDRALYTCSCGYAFDALVSTSVGCPHCGRTQAW